MKNVSATQGDYIQLLLATAKKIAGYIVNRDKFILYSLKNKEQIFYKKKTLRKYLINKETVNIIDV